MCVCVHVRACVCVMCICVRMCMCVHMCVCVCVCMHVCMCVYKHACVHSCMWSVEKHVVLLVPEAGLNKGRPQYRKRALHNSNYDNTYFPSSSTYSSILTKSKTLGSLCNLLAFCGAPLLVKLFPLQGERAHYFWCFQKQNREEGDRTTTDLTIYPRL